MNRTAVTFALAALIVPLAGCFGGDDAYAGFEPGKGYEPTGQTVHIRMWVEDMVKSDIYPGFKANLWAFCAEAADPNDEYSANAIEWREPTGVVERVQSDGSSRVDEDATNKCSVPGPQLRVKQGDTVIVDFTNKHFHPHTIHWHGQFVPWESDGVPGSTQDAVVPPNLGTPNTFRYEFEAKRAGTLWYHCHVDTQFHVMQGLYGIIIVEPQDQTFEPKDIDKEYSLVFSNLIRDQVEFIPPPPGEVFDPHAKHKHDAECGLSGKPGCQNPALDAEPDVFMINGVSAPNTFMRNDTLMTIEPGERIRVRMLNAGPFTIETIHIHGHDFHVTHKDGNPLPAPFWADTILIGPGERYDAVIEGREDAQGIWVMHTHITSRVTNDAMYPGGMLTKLVYKGFEDDITPFDVVELPGGIPPRFAVDIPDDYLDSDFLLLPDGGGEADWSVPIEQPCAVEKVVIDGTISASNPAFEALSTAAVEITDPDGAVVFSGSFGGLQGGDSRFFFEVNETSEGLSVADLLEGEYMLTIGGQTVDARATVTALVDYYPNLTAADNAAQTYGREVCGLIPQELLDANGY